MTASRKSITATLQRAALVGGMTFIVLYFMYHILLGDRGLLAQIHQQAVLDAKQAEVQALEEKVAGLRRKVQGLSDKSLDLDLLDEQVRKVLHYSHPNEAIVIQ